ncbi:MAG TPA: PEP-utilizing enzyme, partial [Steroidobacteraceae bacterium]|nr:PEP-utilizing enzyme [Steroidobacteraceae bacterium]
MIAVETTPKLLPIMKRCAALVTLRGGVTSHAAVVAREIGTPCTVGVDGRLESGRAYLGTEIRESDWITVDGDAGALYAGDVSVEADRLSAEERRLREWEAAGEER